MTINVITSKTNTIPKGDIFLFSIDFQVISKKGNKYKISKAATPPARGLQAKPPV